MAVFALPGRRSGVTMVIAHGGRNIFSLCPLPLRYATVLSFRGVWHTGHGRREATSDRLIASAERQVTIPLTIGLLSGDR